MEKNIKDENLEYIRENYDNPGHAIAYSSPQVIYNYLIENGRKTPLKNIQSIVTEFDAQNLHKEYRRIRVFNPFFIYKRREQIQGDLVDIRQLSKDNDGVNYLFTMIDAFSRRAWVYPLKTKTSKEVANVFSNHLESDFQNHLMESFLSDAGTEFTNREMQKILSDNSIFFQIGRGYNKASICERFNKTFQVLIYKYMTQNETRRYIDELVNLLQSYNERPHRTLNGTSPMEADKKENEVYIRGILRKKYHDIPKATKKYMKQTFQLGDIVRIKKSTARISSEKRAYAQQQKPEYFVIDRIDTRLKRPLFHLKSLSLHDQVEGGFYANEISLVSGNVYKIEKIIKSKGKGRRKKYLVKWAHFDDTHNSWVDAKDITQNYEEKRKKRSQSD